MDGTRFDALTRRYDQTRGRRALLALLGVAACGMVPSGGEARRKKKVKRGAKRIHGCQTLGGATKCFDREVCCDPAASTIGGCAPVGNPVCCASARLAFPPGTTCCATVSDGNQGVCENPAYPHCCPSGIAGCCEAGYPLCCVHPVDGPYCCPPGSTCCPDDPDGCCGASPRGRGTSAAAEEHGGWRAPGQARGGVALITR